MNWKICAIVSMAFLIGYIAGGLRIGQPLYAYLVGS